jgi:hypothetical protein
MEGMRVLIAYEDSYRSYADALQGTIQRLRPGTEVSLVRAEELGDEVARLEPHLVVCDRPNDIDPGSKAAWARLSDDPDVPSEFCLGGRRRRLENPGFRDLMAFVDEAGGLVLSGRQLRGC